VAGRVHVGYVAAPGTIVGPRGVAARGSLVAVSAWKSFYQGNHVLRLFEGSGAMWTAVRVVAGGFRGPGSADRQLHAPHGLRFTGDGTGLAVADDGNGRVSLFRVEDGSFARHVATDLEGPMDVEECEGGWLVACGYPSHIVKFVSDDVGGGGVVRARLGGVEFEEGSGDGEFAQPSALALVPDLGLVVRDDEQCQVFATPDTIAMASMSASRVGWMVAVARGVAHQAGTIAKPRQQAGPTGERRRKQRRSGV
jgi:hypothetical protein